MEYTPYEWRKHVHTTHTTGCWPCEVGQAVGGDGVGGLALRVASIAAVDAQCGCVQ